jgi:dipeptidase E
MSVIRKIVTIGGGDMRRGETAAIDREIVRLSGKNSPRLLFIPTASSDSEGYCRAVQKNFGGKLRCRVDLLLLLSERPSKSEIARKILGADIIYVGGGNTLKMMRLWRRLGVDRLLRRAYHRGAVLCGLSAGSICWYEAGHSDSMSFYNPKRWRYVRVRGLGLIKGLHCPHYDGRTRGAPRRSDFQKMVGKTGETGIALDNRCALEFIDSRFYRVISAKRGAAAYKLRRAGGRITEERIDEKRALSPVSELYQRGS